MKGLVQEKLYTIKIPENDLYVYLQLHKYTDHKYSRLTVDQILSKLKTLDVCYGINQNIVEKSLHDFYADSMAPPPPPILIARGIPAQHQQEKGIHWLINSESKYDYERVIAPDFAIAHTISIAEKKSGKNVFGKVIEAKQKPDEIITEGDGVYSKIIKAQNGQDQTYYYSNFLGIVYLINKQLRVRPLIIADDPPTSAQIELYGFLGDEQHTKVDAFHIMDTIRRLKMTKGWDALKLIEAITETRRRHYSELEQNASRTYTLLSSQKPVAEEVSEIHWKIDHTAKKDIQRVVFPGQTIASYECISEGKIGEDIYGNEIKSEHKSAAVYNVGEGINLSEDNNIYKYRAKYLGIVKVQEELALESLLSVSSDKLTSFIELPIFPKVMKKKLELFHLQKALEEHHITYGIQTESLKNDILALQNGTLKADNEEMFYKTLAAKGKEPKDGIDARVELNQRMTQGKVMKSGRIDFKERSYPWDVKEGDEVGHYIPEVPEEDGVDVYGKSIPANKPQPLELILEGLHKEPDGQLVCDCPGTLIITKHHFQVTDTLILDGNVDNLTGNIHTESTVIINGYIEPGFTVETKADLIINANIEKSIAQIGGNVVIRGGIRGQGSRIQADGEVNVTFMEHAQVKSSTSIVVKENIIDSDLWAKEEVIVGENESRKASIIGGKTHAYQKISVGNLGNDTFIKTVASVGYTKQELDRREQLKNKIQKNQKELDHIEMMYTQGAAVSSNIAQMMDKLEPLGHLIQTQEIELSELDSLIAQSKNSRINVFDTAWPSVTITICCHSIHLSKPFKQGFFYLEDEKIQFKNF